MKRALSGNSKVRMAISLEIDVVEVVGSEVAHRLGSSAANSAAVSQAPTIAQYNLPGRS
jgi:hypothetical protein